MKRLNCNRKTQNKTSRQGFTMVELSLSIAFIGVLSLIIVFLIIDTVSTYRRGLTMNQINTVGMDLVDDMRAAIQDSSSRSVTSECNTLIDNNEDKKQECIDNGGISYMFVQENKDLTIKGSSKSVPVLGAFCTGTYSYIWNTGYGFNEAKTYGGDKASFKYGSDLANEKTDFRLLKIDDRNRGVCVNYKSSQFGVFTVEQDISEPVELLVSDSNDNSLALYDLQASAPADSKVNSELFYSVSFVLGTLEGGINVTGTGNFCSPPSDYEDEKFDYCAINKFNFAARATGE